MIETIKMSSKGQIVIPKEIREEINVEEGSLFAVFGEKDTIVLKKIEKPSKEQLISDLKEFSEKAKKRLIKQGIREQDINKIIHESR